MCDGCGTPAPPTRRRGDLSLQPDEGFLSSARVRPSQGVSHTSSRCPCRCGCRARRFYGSRQVARLHLLFADGDRPHAARPARRSLPPRHASGSRNRARVGGDTAAERRARSRRRPSPVEEKNHNARGAFGPQGSVRMETSGMSMKARKTPTEGPVVGPGARWVTNEIGLRRVVENRRRDHRRSSETSRWPVRKTSWRRKSDGRGAEHAAARTATIPAARTRGPPPARGRSTRGGRRRIGK